MSLQFYPLQFYAWHVTSLHAFTHMEHPLLHVSRCPKMSLNLAQCGMEHGPVQLTVCAAMERISFVCRLFFSFCSGVSRVCVASACYPYPCSSILCFECLPADLHASQTS